MDYNMLTELPTSIYDVYANIQDDGNLVDMILDVLSVYEIELNSEERRLYNCNPKMLSSRIYGDVNIWYIIMRVNNISNFGEFNTLKNPKVKLPTKKSLDTAKTTIYKFKNNI